MLKLTRSLLTGISGTYTGDMTDVLFSVNNASDSNPGSVSVTGVLDREAESTYTINIQVNLILIYIDSDIM